MTSASVEERLHGLRRAVTSSRERVGHGARIDLAGLDGEVEALSTAATAEPQAARAGVLAALSALLVELDGLAAELKRRSGAGQGLR